MDVLEAVHDYLTTLSTHSVHTKQSAKTILKRFATWCQSRNLQTEQIRPIDMSRYTEYLQPLQRSSIGLHVNRIKAFMNWCAAEEDYTKVYARRLVAVTEPNITSPTRL